jgi:hypothetical protein
MTTTVAPNSESAPPRGRLILGGAIFLVGLICPIFVPLVALTDLPGGWKTAISGLLMLGIPEVFMLVSVAILGKPGFEFLKARLLGIFRRYALPTTVGPSRYRLGLVLLLAPLVAGWITPYLESIPGIDIDWLAVAVVGDLVLVAAFVVLGGEFWDKFRALFVHRATARFPSVPPSATPVRN